MDIRQLEMFLCINDLGSINKAAVELRMSQPSLSRWLAMLEHEIGAQLFVRTRQGIRITDAGQVLADRARPLLRQLDILKDEVGKKSARRVNLAMPLSMQRIVTAPFAELILKERPETSLRIYEGMNNNIRQWMEQGAVDVAVIVETERIPDSFSSLPIISETLLLVGHRSAGFRLDRPVQVSDLHRLPLILPGPPNLISANVKNALSRAGLEYLNIFEAEVLSLCLHLVSSGHGYTVMPYCALAGRMGPDSELSAAPIDGLNVIWRLCVNLSRTHNVANRLIVDLLTKFAVDRIASGTWQFAKNL